MKTEYWLGGLIAVLILGIAAFVMFRKKEEPSKPSGNADVSVDVTIQAPDSMRPGSEYQMNRDGSTGDGNNGSGTTPTSGGSSSGGSSGSGTPSGAVPTEAPPGGSSVTSVKGITMAQLSPNQNQFSLLT